MPYIGKSPSVGGFHKLDNLTASATATYALTLGGGAFFPESPNQLLVSLNGVIQAPIDSFTVSGSNIIFDSALTGSDSIDFIMALGDVLNVGTPSDGSVSDAKISSMSASKLTGALPALDGSALTGITAAIKKMELIPIIPKTLTGSISNIPRDNTLPQITEGVQVVQSNYTPAASSSTIFVDACFYIGESSNVANTFGGALFFNDTCVNAKIVMGAGNMAQWIRLQASFSNTNGNALDIEVRCDNNSAFRINGSHLGTSSTTFVTAASSCFGGSNSVNQTFITVTEF
jgi:hypothetical protein